MKKKRSLADFVNGKLHYLTVKRYQTGTLDINVRLRRSLEIMVTVEKQ
jgi:hypothetical protein